MNQITAISNEAKQSMVVVLDDGTKLNLSLEYIEAQQGWFMSIVYGSILIINNRRVVTSPNMLRAFRDVIPFGLACIASDGLEPVYQDDFSAGRAAIYTLTPTDVAYVEETIIPERHD